MGFLRLQAFALLVPLLVKAQAANSSYSDIFTTAGIVPDVLPSFNGTSLELSFGNESSAISIGTGLSVQQVAQRPSFSISDAQAINQDGEYVVIIADPDAPTPQNRTISDVRHFVASNMKIDASGQLVNSTPALWDYISPAPPSGSAPHRYTVLVYHQPENFDDIAAGLINSTNFISWSLADFTSATGLEEPVAGTYFLTGSNVTAAHNIAGVNAAFEGSGIVPGVIPTFNSSALLDVSYPSTAGNGSFIPNTGMNLTIEQVANEPEYLLTSESLNSTDSYVLFLLDPDAPTPANTSLANVLHLLASGLRPSSDLSIYTPLKNSTPALAEYLSPAPPTDAPHRYTYLLYAEPDNFTEKATGLVPAGRVSFNLTDFVAKTGLGAPLAGNFFYSAQNITIS